MDTIQQIIANFNQLSSWEDRYRYLIQLGKKIPQVDKEKLAHMPLIHGCEVEVRFLAEKQADGRYHFSAYSEGRIMNGLLSILLNAIHHLSLSELQQFNITELLQQCGIASRLSETRLNGLNHIETLLHQLD